MVSNLLRRKLLRDVRRQWMQFAAVSAVVLCAIVVFVALQTAYHSLTASRDRYFDRYRMADFFVHLEKAPRSALTDVEAVPGVWRARGRIVKDVSLDVAGNEGSVYGRIISMPARRDGLICDVHLVSGSYFPGASATEVIVNERFCEANGLRVGDAIEATINERRESLRIVGTCYSPEYVYAIRTPRQFAPDDRNFAVIFARESFVEDAFNMTNAFNDVVGLLQPGTDVEQVLEGVKERLDAYGVYHKYGRGLQLSNHYLSEELQGLRMSALVLPMIFLVVAAFVIHVLVRRMVELQRGQIGLLCALGYSRARILWHYTCYALAIGIAGAGPGTLVGYWLAGRMTVIYNMFFRFPSLTPVFHVPVVLFGFALSAGMCAAGAVWSARRILSLQPAEALRPVAPRRRGTVRRSRLAGLWKRLPLHWRITARHCLRAPGRALLTILGVAASAVILLLGLANNDFFDAIIDYQFDLVQRADLRVELATERGRAALFDITGVPGVRGAEPVYEFGAELRNGRRKKTVLVMGLPPESRLYHVYAGKGRRVRLPSEGLLIPRRVADELALRPGQKAHLDPYVRGADEVETIVRGATEEYLGLTVYARLDYLGRLIGSAGAMSGALVDAEPGRTPEVIARLDDIPGVTAVTATRTFLKAFEESMSDLIQASNFILTLFAATVAFAVIYNASSVNIAEQERDLACLCSLGYDREDVARIATNDIMPLGVVGLAVGLPLGYLMCVGLSKYYTTDIYKLPVVANPRTYVLVAVMLLVFQLISRGVCARRARNIDIVARLKSRE